MADFVQRDSEYPRLPDVPELISKSEPYPIVMYAQKFPDKMIAIGSDKTILDELGYGGTVDLSVRPIIMGTKLIEKGWNVPPDEIATVFSSTYTNQDFGRSRAKPTTIIAINVTPILEDGTVLSQSELADAAYDILMNNNDVYKIQMGSQFIGTDMDAVINEAVDTAIYIHELHQEVIEKDLYPYIKGLPSFVPFESPTPYALYAQRSNKLDGYPRITGILEFLPFASPLPWLLFGQHPRILEGYPYIETPQIYKLFDRPIPFLFQKDALHPRCIKYTCRFIKSKSFKITLNCLKNDWCNTDIVKCKIPIVKQKKFTIYF